MPIYEYVCKNCRSRFDVFQSVGAGNEKLTCPECNTPRPERVFSAFASSSSGTAGFSGSSSGGCSSSSPFS